jgi:hypothetical protein
MPSHKKPRAKRANIRMKKSSEWNEWTAKSEWNELVARVADEYHTRHPSDNKWFGRSMKIASIIWRSRKFGETLQELIDRISYFSSHTSIVNLKP